jgi:hypothetical protein
MKRLSALLCLVLLIGIFPVKTAIRSALVYGKVAKLSSGQSFIFPDVILGQGFLLPTSKNPDICALSVNLPEKFSNGDDFVGIGTLDIIEGCFEPEWHQTGEIIWDYGILGDEVLNSVGQKIPIKTDKVRCLNDGLDSNIPELTGMEVDVFGLQEKVGYKLLAISTSKPGYTRFCGVVKGTQETGITDFEASRVIGRRNIEKIKVLAQKKPSTIFFNGSGLASFDNILIGKLGMCAGVYNPQSGILQADTILSGLNDSSSGARLLGIVTSVGSDNFKIRTMLTGCVPATIKCSLDKTIFISGGKKIEDGNPQQLLTPEKTVIEVYGVFENDQFSLKTKLARIDPASPSKYLCGFFKGNDIVDVFGGKTPYKPAELMVLLEGNTAVADGTFVCGWTENGKMIAVRFPAIGLLGLLVKGTLKENRNSSYMLECRDAFDGRLSGRKYEVFFSQTSKVVDAAKGFVSPESVEPNRRMNCWGMVDEKLNFRIVMVDLD